MFLKGVCVHVCNFIWLLAFTMISFDIQPLGFFQDSCLLQNSLVSLPFYLMLSGSQVFLCFGICQVSCGFTQN